MVLHVNMHTWIPFPNWRPMDHIRHHLIESQLWKYPSLSMTDHPSIAFFVMQKQHRQTPYNCTVITSGSMYTLLLYNNLPCFFHSQLQSIYIIDGIMLLSMYVCMQECLYACISTCVVQKGKLKTRENSQSIN